MTIYRQLALLFIGLLVAVFAGTMVSTIQNARGYLQEQLHSHSQDAASALGISVSPYMAAGQMPAIIATADAMFDGGYYRSIVITDMQDRVLVERTSNVEFEGIPAWFVRAIPLETPESEAVIMDGWNQSGIIRVTSHPGYAYRQLWRALVDNARWFVVGAIIATIAGILLIRLTLRPLSRVVRQAEAIGQRKFLRLDDRPRTRELASIVSAMNALSATVERMFRESESAIENFRAMAYQSTVTGLPNRQRFMDILSEKLGSSEECSWALLCLIELSDFKGFNNRNGYVKGDRLLREAASILDSTLASRPKTVIAHLNGAIFTVLTEEPTEPELLGRDLVGALQRLHQSGHVDSRDIVNVGITVFNGSQNPTELMSDADAALRAAQAAGPNCWKFHSSSDDKRPSRTASEWREYITDALRENRLRLLFQPALRLSGRTEMHREVLVRIAETGCDGKEQLVPAGAFIPIAASLGLSTDIDRAVISSAIDYLDSGRNPDITVAINLSATSIKLPEFVDWIDGELRRHRDAATRLCFEISENIVDPKHPAIERFLQLVADRGSQFGLDDVGADIGVFSCLRTFRASYLKIDGSFIRDLDSNADQQFFVRTLTGIAHGLEIDIIAKSVETEAVWDMLARMNVDGAQGYFVGRPSAG